MSGWSRRLALTCGLVLVLMPIDGMAWHHSLLGVAVTVAGCWLVALAVVREQP